MTDKKHLGQELIEKYLKLRLEKNNLDKKLEDLKQEIYTFCQKNKLKSLNKDNILLYVYHIIKTVFPKKSESGRHD